MSTDRFFPTIARWLVLTVTATCCTGAFCRSAARAESGEQAPGHYVSLPREGGSREQGRTEAVSPFTQQVKQGSITFRSEAPTGCLPGALRLVMADLAARFGAVSVESTHRTRGHNGRAGGARHSLHLSCRAIDFRIRSRSRGALAYLRSRPEVGGLKIYRTGIIHIDNGERRSW